MGGSNRLGIRAALSEFDGLFELNESLVESPELVESVPDVVANRCFPLLCRRLGGSL